MKVNELMVGDWVLFSDEPKRVRSIVVSDDNRVERIYVFGKTCQVSTIEDYIQPIPLTPEILEKNGFKYNSFGTGFYECKTEEGNIACTKMDYWLFYINNNIIPNHFYYVHELQHILKLCGIDKEIEL